MPPIDPKLKSLVNGWFKKCRQDLWMAETAIKQADAPNDLIAFHAQQAVEKCLKGLLTYYQIEFPKTHDLNTLAELLSVVWRPLPEPIQNADN